jgi:hypothetical protein
MKFLWKAEGSKQKAENASAIFPSRGVHPVTPSPCHGAGDRFHIIGHEEWAGRGRRTDPGELFDYTKIGLAKDRPSTLPTEQ